MNQFNTAPELNGPENDLVILPVGSTEQHSRHLPVGTDTLLAQAWGDALGARLGAFVLPALPYSTCYEHKGVKGSVWMNADTFYRVLCDLCVNLKEQGFARIIIIKGHGGIFVMDPAVRHLNATYMPDMKVCLLDPFFDHIATHFFETKGEVHAGERETSLMLHLYPQWVKMENAVDFLPKVPRAYLQYGSVFHYSPDGVWGKPTQATAEKGRLYFEACLDECVRYVNEVFGVMGTRGY
jgi:creatinine amidohydrolase